MTHHQLVTLKLIHDHQTSLVKAKKLNMDTLGSLVRRGWIENTKGILLITQSGFDAMQCYTRPRANYRQHPGELTERVAGLLLVHRIHALPKAG